LILPLVLTGGNGQFVDPSAYLPVCRIDPAPRVAFDASSPPPNTSGCTPVTPDRRRSRAVTAKVVAERTAVEVARIGVAASRADGSRPAALPSVAAAHSSASPDSALAPLLDSPAFARDLLRVGAR
jgi:hypothetical protein